MYILCMAIYFDAEHTIQTKYAGLLFKNLSSMLISFGSNLWNPSVGSVFMFVVSYFARMKTTVVFAGKGSLNGAACPDVQRR